jgi:hypothetical protein
MPVESAPPVEVACATEAGTAASAAQQAAAMIKRPGMARICDLQTSGPGNSSRRPRDERRYE